jgi:hypothetical protein
MYIAPLLKVIIGAELITSETEEDVLKINQTILAIENVKNREAPRNLSRSDGFISPII